MVKLHFLSLSAFGCLIRIGEVVTVAVAVGTVDVVKVGTVVVVEVGTVDVEVGTGVVIVGTASISNRPGISLGLSISGPLSPGASSAPGAPYNRPDSVVVQVSIVDVVEVGTASISNRPGISLGLSISGPLSPGASSAPGAPHSRPDPVVVEVGTVDIPVSIAYGPRLSRGHGHNGSLK